VHAIDGFAEAEHGQQQLLAGCSRPGWSERCRIQQVRRELAALHGADACCPVSTAIFLRTVAEAAWDEIEAGKPATEVVPFWRVVDPKSPLAKKLRAGSQWIEQQRLAEAAASRDEDSFAAPAG
jgi:hypothetical protein